MLREDVADWFQIDSNSPHMLMVSDVAEKRWKAMTPQEEALFGFDRLNIARSEIPAVTEKLDYRIIDR